MPTVINSYEGIVPSARHRLAKRAMTRAPSVLQKAPMPAMESIISLGSSGSKRTRSAPEAVGIDQGMLPFLEEGWELDLLNVLHLVGGLPQLLELRRHRVELVLGQG